METCDLVDMCPGLQQLTIEWVSLTGIALAPFARMTTLSSLSMTRVDARHGLPGMLDSLPPSLTSLSINTLEAEDHKYKE